MRTEHIFGSAVGLLLLAISCLWMLAERCSGCGPTLLQVLGNGIIAISALAGASVLALTLWRTQRLWHWCRRDTVPHPPTLRQVCQQLRIPVEQIICTEQSAPLSFCIGLLQPRIVLSTGLLNQVSERELLAILAHEHHHQQQRDPLRLLVVILMRVMLYPLPAIHDFYRAFLVLIEVEADKSAVARSDRPALAAALYKLIARADSSLAIDLPAAVASFSAQASRLDHLLDPQRAPVLPLSSWRLALSLAPFLLLCATMLFA